MRGRFQVKLVKSASPVRFLNYTWTYTATIYYQFISQLSFAGKYWQSWNYVKVNRYNKHVVDQISSLFPEAPMTDHWFLFFVPSFLVNVLLHYMAHFLSQKSDFVYQWIYMDFHWFFSFFIFFGGWEKNNNDIRLGYRCVTYGDVIHMCQWYVSTCTSMCLRWAMSTFTATIHSCRKGTKNNIGAMWKQKRFRICPLFVQLYIMIVYAIKLMVLSLHKMLMWWTEDVLVSPLHQNYWRQPTWDMAYELVSHR